MKINNTFAKLKSNLCHLFHLRGAESKGNHCLDCLPNYKRWGIDGCMSPGFYTMGDFRQFLKNHHVSTSELAQAVSKHFSRKSKIFHISAEDILATWEDGNHGFGPCIGVDQVTALIISVWMDKAIAMKAFGKPI
jgi:hypothetical protein